MSFWSFLRLRRRGWDSNALSSNARSPLQVGPNCTMNEILLSLAAASSRRFIFILAVAV
jgi:hypothetical protein